MNPCKHQIIVTKWKMFEGEACATVVACCKCGEYRSVGDMHGNRFSEHIKSFLQQEQEDVQVSKKEVMERINDEAGELRFLLEVAFNLAEKHLDHRHHHFWHYEKGRRDAFHEALSRLESLKKEIDEGGKFKYV